MSKKPNRKSKTDLNFNEEGSLYSSKHNKEFSSLLAKINTGSAKTYSDDINKNGRVPEEEKKATTPENTEKDKAKPNSKKILFNIKKLTNSGNKYFEQKDYKKAVEYYDQVLEISPDDKPVLKSKALAAGKYGRLLYEQRKFTEAEQYLNIALSMQPNNPFVHHNLGNLYQYKPNPDYGKATYHYKKGLSNANRHDKFNKKFTEQQLALIPRHALKIYLENEDYKEAEQYVELVDKYAASDEISLARAADLKSRLGDMEEAKRYSNKAVEILRRKLGKNIGDKSIDTKLFTNKLFIYNVSSLKIFLVAIEREEDNAANWKSLGVNLFSNQAGYKPEALKCLDTALVLNQGDLEALYHKICLLKDMGHLNHAFELCSRLFEMQQEKDTEDYKTYQLLASLETLVTHKPSQLYERLTGNKENMVDTLITMGQNLYAIDKFDEAISKYNQALRINPNHSQSPFIICNKATAKMGKKQYEGAIKLLDQALDLATNNKDIIYSQKGLALLICNKYLKAKMCFVQAIEIREQDLYLFYKGITEIFNPNRPNDITETFKDFKAAYELSSSKGLNINAETRLLVTETLQRADQFLPKDYIVCPDVINNTFSKLYKTIWDMRLNLRKKTIEFKAILKDIPDKIIEFQKCFDIDLINKAIFQVEALCGLEKVVENKEYDIEGDRGLAGDNPELS